MGARDGADSAHDLGRVKKFALAGNRISDASILAQNSNNARTGLRRTALLAPGASEPLPAQASDWA